MGMLVVSNLVFKVSGDMGILATVFVLIKFNITINQQNTQRLVSIVDKYNIVLFLLTPKSFLNSQGIICPLVLNHLICCLFL
jgi:hypothetical protein